MSDTCGIQCCSYSSLNFSYFAGHCLEGHHIDNSHTLQYLRVLSMMFTVPEVIDEQSWMPELTMFTMKASGGSNLLSSWMSILAHTSSVELTGILCVTFLAMKSSGAVQRGGKTCSVKFYSQNQLFHKHASFTGTCHRNAAFFIYDSLLINYALLLDLWVEIVELVVCSLSVGVL